MNERSARLILGLGPPLLVGLTGYLPYALLAGELPDRVASHFDLAGTPDSSLSVVGLAVAVSTVVAAGLVATGGLALWPRPLPPAGGPSIAFTGAFLAQMGACLLTWTALTQRGLDDWTEADGSGPLLLAILAIPLAVGAGAARASTHLPIRPEDAEPGTEVAALDLAPGEQAVWTGSMRVPWMTFGGAALIVVGLASGAFTTWIGLGLGAPGLALVALSTIRVRADRTGLTVRYGLLPWPATHIAIDRIERATVIDVRPGRWGGWGYRGSLRLGRRAAVVLRGGPGLRLDLRGNQVFVVTVDRPEAAAALLSAELGRTPTA